MAYCARMHAGVRDLNLLMRHLSLVFGDYAEHYSVAVNHAACGGATFIPPNGVGGQGQGH